ncbi:GNAT family N-acetyltransferase [Phenylobacterium sp. J426]|uniref:GNAT family N-acetyltransferase n=1 Tax=Phenylobacterium sp. J426 TaxID=2898439 RepID=UPI0021518BD9|nr:GNAT family N-acetyltransferase [Phenylobacterium sp. J426]MCR5875818.1 GNAT family N-acetyltransferase [Phenylobacterium sp. J426]
MRIRTAKVEEKAALEALQMRASLEGGAYRAELLANPGVVEIPERQLSAGQVLLADADGEILGLAALEFPSDSEAELDGLFVEPGAWGRGLGRALVDACEALVRGRGAHVMTVVANPDARAFYLRCGFVETGAAATLFGPALAMRKTLD